MTTKSLVNPGDEVIVFDCDSCKKDIGDNSQFYLPAIVDKVYQNKRDLEWLADVSFVQDNRKSKGHFQSGLVLVKKS